MMEKEIMIDPQEFSSSDVGLIKGKFESYGFNIPIYQRLYAWGKREVEKLMIDLKKAFENPEQDYYLGNVTLNFNTLSGFYNVIDGQQRLTTLWLIGLVFKLKGGKYWEEFLTVPVDSILLNFTARRRDKAYLVELVNSETLDKVYSISTEDVNPMMIDAIRNIDHFLENELKTELSLFSEFVYHRCKMVAIFLPDSINLNKYFEDMNNRGLQLEPQHILKAQLLQNVDAKYVDCYSRIWDAVSQMTRYLEYNFNGGLGRNRQLLINGPSVIDSYLEVFEKDDIGFSLKDLISQGIEEITEDNKPRTEDTEADKLGTIVKFEEFLLHCLRLYTGDYSISVEDKRLLREFQRPGRTIDSEKFIKAVFKYRIIYDQFVIKLIDTGDGNIWDIREIQKNENGDYARGSFIKTQAIIQLQSMLNVSTAPSRWLTKLLKYLEINTFDEITLLRFLTDIDQNIAKENLSGGQLKSVLNRGTNTNRYWFFKLDYLLWKEWVEKISAYPELSGINHLSQKIRNFQFRDNRSVEHIEPRNPDQEKWDADQDLEINKQELIKIKDRFGNLALISVSANSSYNNQPTKNKKQDFISRTNKWGIESLKLLEAYDCENWTIERMDKHHQKMIDILERHH